MFPFLNVHSGSYHHPVVPVKVLAGVVDARVLEDGDVSVESLGGCWSDRDLSRMSRSY